MKRTPPPDAPRIIGVLTLCVNVLLGAALGGLVSLLFLLIPLFATVIALISGVQFAPDGGSGFSFVLNYVVSFVIGGGVAGLFWPVRRWIGGYYGLGIINMLFVVGGISLHEYGRPSSWEFADWFIWVFLSVAFGLAAGHGVKSASIGDIL